VICLTSTTPSNPHEFVLKELVIVIVTRVKALVIQRYKDQETTVWTFRESPVLRLQLFSFFLPAASHTEICRTLSMARFGNSNTGIAAWFQTVSGATPRNSPPSAATLAERIT